MRLTAYTDYSLRVLIYLALNNDRPVTVREIAESYGISKFHLMKVVQQLTNESFIEALRGRSGGLRLAMAPENIVIGDVVRRMEEEFKIVECFGDKPLCIISPACRLKGVLNEALKAFLGVLDSYTLKDLCVRARALAVLFPDAPSKRKDRKKRKA
ncbi:MAG: Rrf2 family transcriptional regulator [Alphaproteobacteria bacterium]|nr:Rrf2 family transcriptional regulator [Alphaproteobacteria bacterium]